MGTQPHRLQVRPGAGGAGARGRWGDGDKRKTRREVTWEVEWDVPAMHMQARWKDTHARHRHLHTHTHTQHNTHTEDCLCAMFSLCSLTQDASGPARAARSHPESVLRLSVRAARRDQGGAAAGAIRLRDGLWRGGGRRHRAAHEEPGACRRRWHFGCGMVHGMAWWAPAGWWSRRALG